MARVPPRLHRLLTLLRGWGYDRRSLGALGILAAVCTVVAVNWWELVELTFDVDWLLTGIWAFMGALLLHRVSPRRDLTLASVALAGGLLIEAWGTQTRLWTYFTQERPPLWILPAWPVAALAIDRLARLLDARAGWLRRLGPAYWVVMPGFVVLMSAFIWPTIDRPTTRLVLALMAAVTIIGVRKERDLVLFIAGAGLGIFLEYWGTSRHCWTYYTREMPPAEAVLAHGFASVAFARGVQLMGWSRAHLGRLRTRADAPPPRDREIQPSPRPHRAR